MASDEQPRLAGVHIDHPGARDRAAGAQSQVRLSIDRRLRSGKLDQVPLTEDELVRLIAEGGRMLALLRGVRLHP